MRKRILRLAYLFSAVVLLAQTGFGQVTTGNGAWTPVNQTSTIASNWGWRGVTEAQVGYATYQSTWAYCHNSQNMPYPVYGPFVYNDPSGTPHSFAISITPGYYSFGCAAVTSGSALATDGSGYTMTATISGNSVSVTITTVHGLTIPVPQSPSGSATTITDPNGNRISATYASGTTTFQDTLGTTALTVSAPGGGSAATYTFPGPNGNYTYTVKYTQMTVQTGFACYGITDFPATLEWLVSEIDLPDQATNSTDKYTFTYEKTFSYESNVTGRLASVTLPTGGTISYSYSGGSNGINCGDGSAAILSRYTPDTGSSNPWIYTHTLTGPGAATTTTVQDPQGNTTTYNFQGILETERQVAQLENVTTCYNGNPSPCNTTPVPSVAQITSTTTLGGQVSKTNTSYSFYGLPWEVDEYDFGNGTPGALIRKTITTFGTWQYPSDVQIQDGGGNVKSHTSYALNSFGNPTGETDYTGGSPASISRTYTPNTYGIVTSSTDYNTNQTTYSNFECPSGSGPFPGTVTTGTLSTTLTWDCNGGVVTQVTDANQQSTTIKHTDVNSWRVTEVDYPDGGQVQFIPTYGDPYTVTTKTLVRSNVYHQLEQTLDSLGRVHLSQDTSAGSLVTTNYDSNGRVYSVENPAGGTTSYSYDALNRVADNGGPPYAIQYPDSASYTKIEYSANCATIVDPAGETRKVCSDGVGRVNSVGEDPSGLNYSTSYTYDPLNDLLGVNQSGRNRTYTYDWLGRMTYASTPEAVATSYSFANSSGAVCSGDPSAVCRIMDARGVTTNYAYNDPLNRLTGKTYQNDSANTPPATYSYDQTSVQIGNWTSPTLAYPKGRLTSAVTTSGGTVQTGVAFSYDPMGRPTSYWQCTPVNCGNSMWLVGYGYDQAGDVVGLSHPAGYTISNSINEAQQITQVSSTRNDSTSTRRET